MYVQIYIIGGGIQPGRIKHSWFYFGFECIVNWKHEPIIVGIGGESIISSIMNPNTDIFLFNCRTFKMVHKHKVLSNLLY